MSTLAERKRNLGRVPVKWIVLAAYVFLVLVSRWVTSADRLPNSEPVRQDVSRVARTRQAATPAPL